MKKKIVSFMLIFSMILTMIPVFSVDAVAATKGSASAIVSSAESYVGKSKSALGLTGEWCAKFVYYCAKKSGNTKCIGSNVYVGTMAEQTVNDKGGTIIFVNKNAYNACKNRFNASRCKYDPNYIPKKGDLYIQKGEDLGDQYFAHIGIVRKNSSKKSVVYTIEGNTTCSDGNHTDFGYVEYKTRNNEYLSAPYGFSAFVKPKYDNVTSWAESFDISNVASSGKPYLKWDKRSSAAKYKVYRKRPSASSYTLIKTTTNLNYTDTTAVPSNTYLYYVKAVDSKGNKLQSTYAVKRACDLARPTLTSIANVSSTGGIRIYYTGVKNARQYKLYRATSSGGTYSYVKKFDCGLEKGGEKHYFTDNTGVPGKRYYYKVCAVNTNNSGATSALSKYMYRYYDLAKPAVKIKSDSSGRNVVYWDAVKNADKYKLYRSTDAKNYSCIYTGTSKSVTNSLNIVSGQTYYYKVQALKNDNSYATSAYSNVVSGTYKKPANTEAITLSNYSGPASTIKKGTSVYMKGSFKSNYKITAVSINIYNSKGEQIQKGIYYPNANTADLSKADLGKIYFSKLNKGTYTLKVKASAKINGTIYTYTKVNKTFKVI